FPRVGALAKHVVAFSVVVSSVGYGKCRPRQFPGRLVIAVIGRVSLPESRDRQTGLVHILPPFIERLCFRQLLRRHLRVPTRGAGGRVWRAPDLHPTSPNPPQPCSNDPRPTPK